MVEKIPIKKLSLKGKNNLRLFFRFLEENHCFTNYQKAFINSKHNNIQSFQTSFPDFCNTNINLILLVSFVWGETEEGFDFWDKIHKRFITLLNQLEGIAK